MTSRVSRLVLLFLALGSAAQAAMVTRRWGTPPRSQQPLKVQRERPPTGYVAETRTAPAIDGKLDDPCWAKASPLVIGHTLDGGAGASAPTEVRLLRDDGNLYVAVRCVEPFLGKLKGAQRAHDGDFWNDDSVEMILGAASS